MKMLDDDTPLSDPRLQMSTPLTEYVSSQVILCNTFRVASKCRTIILRILHSLRRRLDATVVGMCSSAR